MPRGLFRVQDELNYTEAAVAALFGSLCGSFLNVVIYRLPKDQSVVSPRSRCPHCGKPISARYPQVEAATAALAGALMTLRQTDPYLG